MDENTGKSVPHERVDKFCDLYLAMLLGMRKTAESCEDEQGGQFFKGYVQAIRDAYSIFSESENDFDFGTVK